MVLFCVQAVGCCFAGFLLNYSKKMLITCGVMHMTNKDKILQLMQKHKVRHAIYSSSLDFEDKCPSGDLVFAQESLIVNYYRRYENFMMQKKLLKIIFVLAFGWFQKTQLISKLSDWSVRRN